MNERFTALYALLAAEAAGSGVLWLLAPARLRNAGLTSPTDMLLPHFGIVAVLWTTIAVFVWLLVPGVWRIRQELRNKLRSLAWVCGVGLVLDNLVSIWLYLDPAGIDGADVRIIHYGRSLALALVLRSVAGLIFFWVAVRVDIEVDRRKVVQVTPPPKFGRG